MRDHGVYGWYINEEETAETRAQNTLCFGLCLPSWPTFASVSLAITLNLVWLEDGLNFNFGFRMQNRVSMTSPLMQACQTGNIHFIHQILNEKQGSVHDRSTCRGLTPLLVRLLFPKQNKDPYSCLQIAIRGGHFEATEYLLKHGADPNIPDDDQV